MFYECEDSRKGTRKFGISDITPIKDKNIMIVDDVFTNANTKGPMSDLLKSKGASKIYIGVIGRTKFE